MEIRREIGFAPEDECLFPHVQGVEFVAYAGELVGMSSGDALQRSHEVLDYVGLGEARYRKVESYSTGMKQRLKLASAIVHDPKLLILDEPTNGMDPAGREEVLELPRDLAHNKGMNLIFSSHILPDVEAVCDYVVVLGRGKLLAQGEIRRTQAGSRPDVRCAAQNEFAGDSWSDWLREGCTAEPNGRFAARANSGGPITANIVGSCGGRAESTNSPSCGRNGARWKKCFLMRWSDPDADFRSRLSALVGRAIGPRMALAGDYAARCEDGAARAVCAVGDPCRRGCRRCCWRLCCACGDWSSGSRIWSRRLSRHLTSLLRSASRRGAARISSAIFGRSAFTIFCRRSLDLSMVLVLLVGPNLVSQDLRYNALPLYFSRPLRRIDYFLGKLGVIMALLGSSVIGAAPGGVHVGLVV